VEWWKFVILIVVSYLIGNIFFAKIISRAKHYDILKVGSGNPGTMNMVRNMGFWVGFLTLIFDMLKGIVPALFGKLLFGWTGTNAYVGLFVGGLSSLVGTIFPVFYHFKGGKGVAAMYGMFCVANPILGVFTFVFGFMFLLLFDYASVMSFFIITIFTIYEAFDLGLMSGQGNIVLSCLLFAIFILIIFAHRQNILRLLTGKENRLNFKKSFSKHSSKTKN
jgi:glycerol-3-phosphate acyltransferase PlsY